MKLFSTLNISQIYLFIIQSNLESMFILYQIALAPARKPYRIELFCSHIGTVIAEEQGEFSRQA